MILEVGLLDQRVNVYMILVPNSNLSIAFCIPTGMLGKCLFPPQPCQQSMLPHFGIFTKSTNEKVFLSVVFICISNEQRWTYVIKILYITVIWTAHVFCPVYMYICMSSVCVCMYIPSGSKISVIFESIVHNTFESSMIQ